MHYIRLLEYHSSVLEYRVLTAFLMTSSCMWMPPHAQCTAIARVVLQSRTCTTTVVRAYGGALAAVDQADETMWSCSVHGVPS